MLEIVLEAGVFHQIDLFSNQVSILVVLEIVLEDGIPEDLDNAKNSFNPCCVGNSSGSSTSRKYSN